MTILSVVVPTRNRAHEVTRLLRALEQQAPVDGGFEVIVVADGCTDGTEARLRSAAWSFPLHVLQQSESGAATARNCGAALASGRTLLFLDDDVEPERGALNAHVSFHASQSRAIALGYLPPIVEQGGFLGVTLRDWWDSMFDRLRMPGHRYWYKDLLSGHFSIAASAFHELGGFDPSLRCHEDYEFGYRSIRSGLALRFLPDAVAWHHETSNLVKIFQRKFDEGVADVQLARTHPELIPSLPLARPVREGRVARALVRCAWKYPHIGDRLASQTLAWLPRYERWRLRFRWRARLDAVLVYWYWRGVASAIGSGERLARLVSDTPRSVEPEMTVDLSGGLRLAEALVDEKRPKSVRLVLGGRHVGVIPDVPGAETLRGIHLRKLLARDFAPAYLRAVAGEGVAPELIAAALEPLPPLDPSRQAFAA
jgi:glycosyltransferase involved in cell wall biosynthesis